MGTLEERNPSLWVGTSQVTRYPQLSGELHTDVVIVGAGITGLTAGVLLKHEGRGVVVVEAGRVAAGVTGYTTAKLAALHGLVYADLSSAFGDEGARQYADANVAGIAQVATLAERYGIDCDLEQRPAYTYTTDEDMVDKVRAEVSAAQRIGLEAEFTTETALPYPVQGAIRLENQAQFHPRKYCTGLAAAIPGAGGHLFEHTRATSLDEQGERYRVQTSTGAVIADHVIIATHLPFHDLGFFFARSHPMRSYALSASLEGPVPHGMYLASDTPTRSVRSAVMDGREVAILGGEGHKVGQEPDTRQRYAALEEWARQNFAIRSIEYRWSAQDYMPVDHVPFVGPASPASERILVATGFSKWGMSNGTAAAIMLADRIGGRGNRWASLFDTNRVNPKQSVKELIKENADVVKRFVQDRLTPATGRSADDLAPGEAEVLAVGGRRVAAYRDEGGALHAVSPVCTDLGCTVAWNTAETTWDCPCHGSRFTCDGAVVQGPAVEDLEAMSLSGP